MAFSFFKKSEPPKPAAEEGPGKHYFNLTVKAIVQETRDSISIAFSQPADRKISYKSGQFLTLMANIEGKEIRRAYSLCSSPFVDEDLVVLVKPQFEVGREGLSKGGIVKDERLYQHVQRNITDLCQQLGLQVKDFFDSSIKGGDGNREFFVFASKPGL